MTEDRMVGWHHRLIRHESEQAWRDSGGQKSWPAAVLGVTKSQIRLSNSTTTTILLGLF